MSTRSVKVGRVGAVRPGDIVAFDVDGAPIAVVNAGGRMFAISDRCTHEECSLAADGILEGTVVTCGCHGAQFDVATGRVLAPPAVEPLAVYPLRVVGDDILVEVG